jgi:hypothetical protein
MSVEQDQVDAKQLLERLFVGGENLQLFSPLGEDRATRHITGVQGPTRNPACVVFDDDVFPKTSAGKCGRPLGKCEGRGRRRWRPERLQRQGYGVLLQGNRALEPGRAPDQGRQPPKGQRVVRQIGEALEKPLTQLGRRSLEIEA